MIEIKNLTKRYHNQLAVDDVSFMAPPGTVTGFLGPNGAGKSTTLRMIAALTRPTSGEAKVLGVDYRSIANPARHIGVLLDASAQHAGRTGRETLVITAKTIGVDPARVDEMLDRVGLEPSAARKRVGNYSLGMRQRLGIAQVLLGDPRALILDEPANGLDPEGIIWMRGLLRNFADRGGTVLLSSHLLHEVEAIADRLVLINRGRIVAQGEKAAMVSSSGTLVCSPQRAALERALSSAGIELSHLNGAVIAEAEPATVGAVANEARVQLSELRAAQDGGLEELFLSLTTGQKETDR